MVNWKDAIEKIPADRNTVGMPLRTTTQVWTGTGPSAPPISIGRQKIEGPRWSIIPQEVSNAKPRDASINRNLAQYRDPTPSWSKAIGSEKITNESANVYARGRMNSGVTLSSLKVQTSCIFGLLSVNTTNELGSILIPTTRSASPTDGSN